jgi:hypothetical protein
MKADACEMGKHLHVLVRDTLARNPHTPSSSGEEPNEATSIRSEEDSDYEYDPCDEHPQNKCYFPPPSDYRGNAKWKVMSVDDNLVVILGQSKSREYMCTFGVPK